MQCNTVRSIFTWPKSLTWEGASPPKQYNECFCSFFSIFGCICATCSCQKGDVKCRLFFFSTVCLSTTNFVNGPFVALEEMVHFAPWDRFFDFSFPSYGRFRKKKRQTHQKVFLHPTVEALSANNSPSTEIRFPEIIIFSFFAFLQRQAFDQKLLQARDCSAHCGSNPRRNRCFQVS